MVLKGNNKLRKEERPEENTLLAEICDLGLEMKRLRGLLKQHKDRYDELLEQAVKRKLTATKDYCLILKPVTKKTVDMPAVLSEFPVEVLAPYLRMNLKDLGNVVKPDEQHRYVLESTTDTWLVANKRGPWDRIPIEKEHDA